MSKIFVHFGNKHGGPIIVSCSSTAAGVNAEGFSEAQSTAPSFFPLEVEHFQPFIPFDTFFINAMPPFLSPRSLETKNVLNSP